MWQTMGRDAVRAGAFPVQGLDQVPVHFNPPRHFSLSGSHTRQALIQLASDNIAPPQAARPTLLESRTLDEIIDSDLTSPTEMAPESVRSSSSQLSQGPSGEPEQEPDMEDEAIPSITSPPDDIYLL